MRMMRMQTLRRIMLVKANTMREKYQSNCNVSFWRLNEISGWNSWI